jgi:Nif-specific regulatory protein
MLALQTAADIVPARRLPEGAMAEADVRLELLADLGDMIAREVDLDTLLGSFAQRVAEALRAERATVFIVDAATGELRARVASRLELDELRVKPGQGVAGHVAAHAVVVNIPDVTADPRWAPEFDRRTGFRTRSMLCAPIQDRGRQVRGVVQVLNRREGVFSAADEKFVAVLADQIARALAFTTLHGGDEPRGVPWRGPYNHIVGPSRAMQQVYERVVRAAATDATVLLRGETGTGKGLFARAIHVNSRRAAGPLVTVDGTSLPAALVESELFGHERGSFTGAERRAPGKVEAAAGGTLFLDEIGEIPPELQGKLLRLLQDREFERIGGRETLKADVRIVAATNRDLERMVREGAFRADLYYRVRLLDIELPTLRRRGREDILALAEHFLLVSARRYGRSPLRFTPAAVEAMAAHAWPGNVRELEHAVERAVVLCTGSLVDADALGLVDVGGAAATAAPASSSARGAEPADGDAAPGLTLDEMSRRYALAALRRHGGNRSATARELNIGRNTLARLLRDDAPAGETEPELAPVPRPR